MCIHNEQKQSCRIGVDAHVLAGKYQGSRTWLTNVISRAAAIDLESTYVIYSLDQAQARELIDGPNVEHRPIPIRSPIPRLLVYWPSAIISHQLDYLLTQYMSPLLFPRKQIVVVHDILFRTHPEFFPFKTRWRNRILTRLSAKRARGVITVSKYSLDGILGSYRLQPTKMAIVPNGCSQPALSSQPAPPVPKPYALFVGRLEPRKNARQLLDAFDRVPTDSRLVIVGTPDGERPDTLARILAAPRVLHLTDVSPGDLAALYQHASVTVMPSLAEGFGLPIIEALANGCPVIAANSAALPEVGGRVATYYDPCSDTAVADLAQLLAQAFAGTLPYDREAVESHLATLDWDRAAHRFIRFVTSLKSSRDIDLSARSRLP
jgi:glycosyltransferase involved in cell wall biosynthesis